MLTRERLVRAAADAFARTGYTGTSLQDICRIAQISMGALTFHFARKNDLAAAVKEAGITVTRHEVDVLRRGAPDPLAAVVTVTCGLVDLLSRDARVRAAQSLTHTAPMWDEAWVPQVRLLLHDADRRGLLAPTADPETLVRLAVHLVHGAAATLHARPRPRTDPATELAQLWAVVRDGVTTRSPSHSAH
ncbi:TetR/AcrR family transcriptional regulator [Streptomyces ficellus]|uniref:TetR/AcrR family transcriptional regulator n=1 Tax=Streptomyces ficellus TaxID=1977088 RepID=A0A6I6FMB5_9ACTN|nr:TetR/AcrR family transcriptional regulator [Streptomyces ficellus]